MNTYCELSVAITNLLMLGSFIPSALLTFWAVHKSEAWVRRRFPKLVSQSHQRQSSNALWTMICLVGGLVLWGALLTLGRDLLCAAM